MRGRIEQDRCCEAVLRIFERRLGTKRTNIVFPEKENRVTEDVEVCATIGSTRLAIEHTLIEPMPRFIELNLRFQHFAAEFEGRVAGKVPASYAFQLIIPGMELRVIKNRQVAAIAKAVAHFAIGKTALLTNPPNEDHSIPSDILEAMSAALRSGDTAALANEYAKWGDLRARRMPPRSIVATPVGVPLSVTLAIVPNPPRSWLGTVRVKAAAANIEAQRRQRVITALKCKQEKLARYREHSYKPVLILESNDFVLTSDETVFKALSAALRCVPTVAEDIIFADTCTETYVFRHFLIDGQKNIHWYADWGEFNAKELALPL